MFADSNVFSDPAVESSPSDPCSGLVCTHGSRCMIRINGDSKEGFCSCDAICTREEEDTETEVAKMNYDT